MSIQITNVDSEAIASQYVYYLFTINYGNQQEWVIKKRYSDFVTLHEQLKPPFILPPKRYFSTSASVIDERKVQLRQYLLQCVQFMNHPIFRDFVGLDKELEKQAVTFDGNFHTDVQTVQSQITKIEILIQQRVESVRSNQIHQSYKINQEIHKKVMPLKDYLPTLYQLMQSDQNTGGELDRKMKSYREVEMRIQSIIKGIQESPRKRVFGSSNSPSTSSIPVPLGSPSLIPGSLNKNNAVPVYSNTSSSLPNAQQLLQQQDQNLDLIMKSLRVQKQIGLDMHSEIDLQNKILDDINMDVDKVDRKVNMANKRAKKLA